MNTHEEFVKQVKKVTDDIFNLLVEKNKSYGNSATNPVRIFSKASTTEQIKVRIDDKLSRLLRGSEEIFNEDTINDLIGYLVILKAEMQYEISKNIAHSDEVKSFRKLVEGMITKEETPDIFKQPLINKKIDTSSPVIKNNTRYEQY